jgi:RNA polymerase sigma-70 factor, ECF subfamily
MELMVVEVGVKLIAENESDVVRRAKQGDQLAFGRLFARYNSPVLSFLYGLVGQRDAAEDMMQETFSRAFAFLEGLRDEARFSTWLFGIARNVARESIRRRERDRDRTGFDDAGVDELSDPLASPENEAMRRQLHQAIRSGLAALDGERRMVLALRVFADKSYQEIADITGWSMAKVKTEIHRARLEMRKMIGPYL